MRTRPSPRSVAVWRPRGTAMLAATEKPVGRGVVLPGSVTFGSVVVGVLEPPTHAETIDAIAPPRPLNMPPEPRVMSALTFESQPAAERTKRMTPDPATSRARMSLLPFQGAGLRNRRSARKSRHRLRSTLVAVDTA